MSYFEHLVACKQAEDAAYKIEQAEKAKRDSRIAELEARIASAEFTDWERVRALSNKLKNGWRCFHCDTWFYTREEAAEHFGVKGTVVSCLKSANAQIAELEHENERLRNFSQSNVHSSSYIDVLQRAEKAETALVDHLASHLCLKRHEAEEKPTYSKSYLCKIQNSHDASRIEVALIWFCVDQGKWETSWQILEWYSLPESEVEG